MMDAEHMAAEICCEFEGFSAHPYLDRLPTTPVWTIGFGSIWQADGRPVTRDTPPLTRAQALDLAARELRHAAGVLARDVRVPLTAHQTAALESFVFNLGEGNFEASTLLRKLRARDYDGAANEFAKWDCAGGKHLAGLARRRAAEAALFRTPDTHP